MKSRRQHEGSKPVPGAPLPASDDYTVLINAPEVLNDPCAQSQLEWGRINPLQPPKRSSWS